MRRSEQARMLIGLTIPGSGPVARPAAACVRATVHDAVGRQLGVLDVGSQQPGTHRLSWNHDRGGRKLASGAYFVLIDMGVEKVTLKAVIR
jgi:hypothetical protein